MKDADSQIIGYLQRILAATGGGAGAVWGAITGTLTNQTDLNDALALKQTAAQVQDAIDAEGGTGANDLVRLDGDSKLPAVDGSALTNLPAGAAPYLVYTALLTQSGTDVPVATVLQNTIGVITFNRDAPGKYSVNGTSLFTANKTVVFTHADPTDKTIGHFLQADIQNASASAFTLYSFTQDLVLGPTAADGLMNHDSLEIRVYP